MNTPFLLVVVFVAGVSSGWLGKTWLGSEQTELTAKVSDNSQSATISGNNSQNLTQALESTTTNSNDTLAENVDFSESLNFQKERQLFEQTSPASDIHVLFSKLLNDRLYYDAMVLYQEQIQQNEKTTIQLKRTLLDHLGALSESRNNNDFSELIENYLSIYYDDIDVLLLLADFNRANGSYLETVDVYLLANTYAYSDIAQQNLLIRFNNFVKEIDQIYTTQKDWQSLINFYSHIDTSGLMTSTYQYRQALAHLGYGDVFSATEHLKQLVNDSLVGEQAAIALNKISGNNGAIAATNSSAWDDSETIELQQLGNQYLVNLTVNRQDHIKLLIDTGASITTLSQASFYSLNSNRDAVEQDSRVFRTANGVVRGTVYLVPEITLGPYLLKNTQIAVLDFDMAQGIDGLLGMNVLGQFRFQIDQENNNLLLNRN